MATAYPFDPSGTSAANRIVNEQHVITAVNFRDYHYVIPKFAPFFAESMVLRMQYPNGNIRTLTQGLDYYFSHQFLDASRACAKPVYGSISFLDTDEAGVLSITYQSVGGIWTLSASEISRILAEQMRNPRITAWEQITYLPERFPIIDHEWDLVDMVGASEVVRAIDDITTTIANSTGGGLQSHITNYSNPHNVTKTQVGLGNVQNYASATKAQAEAGTANNLYMTPLRVKESIAIFGQQLVNAHSNRTDNPHQVTKAQVGLSNVQNYPMASNAEAIAGSATDRYISPSALGAAITSLIRNDFDAHTTNTNNPHNVTKAQIGLVYVENFPVASAEEARAGTRADRYMTPQRTTQLMAEYVNTRLMEHELRIDNPHEVNKVQVGLGQVQNYPMADLGAASDPSSMSHYVSPAVAAAIALAKIDEYMGSTENPAGVTKAMVGLANVENYAVATQTQAEAGSVNNAYMTPLRTRQAIAAIAQPMIDLHANNTSNPHGVTKAQVGLSNVNNYATATASQTSEGTATNLFVTPAGVSAAFKAFLGSVGDLSSTIDHVSNFNNPHNVTAQQIGAVTPHEVNIALSNYLLKTDTSVSGMSRDDFIELTLMGKSGDSELFNGMDHNTYADWLIQDKLGDSVVDIGTVIGSAVSTSAPVARSKVIQVYEFSLESFQLFDQNSTPVNGREIKFLIHGGNPWSGSESAESSTRDVDPSYLVTARINSDGVPSVKAVQLDGYSTPHQDKIEFAYSVTDGSVSIFLSTSVNHRPIIVNKLSPYGQINSLGTLAQSLTGLTFVTPQRGIDNAIRLNGQLPAYYATKQSVTDLSGVVNSLSQSHSQLSQSHNTLSQTVTAQGQTIASHTQTINTHTQNIDNLTQRLAVIENLLASITVA